MISSPTALDLSAFIESHYRSCGVERPDQVSLRLWDLIRPTVVKYRDGPTTAYEVAGVPYVYTDKHVPLPLRRVMIAHEIGHILRDAGNQISLTDLERGKSERGADLFSLEALMPEYLLRNTLRSAPYERGSLYEYLADLYCVPAPFAACRLGAEVYMSNGISESAPDYECSMRDPCDRKFDYLLAGDTVVGVRKRKGSLSC